MSDNPTYTENIRKLTTAAEQDDAVTTGKILSQLGPEQWDKAVKDMLALNKSDIDGNKRPEDFVPPLSVEMEKAGTNETLTVFQQGYGENHALAVGKVTEDITGRGIGAPAINGDVVRQLTTSAEEGNWVETARILKSLGTEKWGEVTKDMVALNQQDIRNRKDLSTHVPFITVGYERNGLDETITVFEEPQYQLNTPLAKVSDRKF